MVSEKAVTRFTFICICGALQVVTVSLGLLQLPFKLLSSLFSRSPQPPSPGVDIVVHEPLSTQEPPRDTLLLIHGFPDGPDLWNGTVKRLTAEGYRCLVVALPGSRGEPVPRSISSRENVDMIKAALLEKCTDPVTVIAHDWGAVYAIYLKQVYSEVVKRLVIVDVGRMSTDGDIHWTAWVAIASYQVLLATMYVIGDPAGSIVLRWFLRIWKYNARPLKEVSCSMAHSYLGIIEMLGKSAIKGKEVGIRFKADKNPTIPHLFAYGRRKNFMFHDSQWLADVRASPCGEVVAMPGHHWLMTDLADEWETLVSQWLEKSEGAIKPKA